MASTIRNLALCLFGAALVVACGDNLTPTPQQDVDAPPTPPAVCPNGMVEAGEDCDDGDMIADVTCDESCRFTCGNGRVDDTLGELCDTGITSGEGECPSACDDGMACTQDSLESSLCTAQCLNVAITAPADGDGCCPTGANSTNDDDCQAMCGNGVLESGEVCDTGIATGVGACPATCDDLMSCTADTLMNGGSCQATCANVDITQPMNGDGCCPPGANTGNDDDCLPGCGNGVVDPGETCDTAITTGPGRCPTTCTDGMVCTRDVLANDGTCTAVCTFPDITQPMNGDGCCPAGANNNNDNDCAPVCRNGVVEQGEQCDDGNNVDTDACNNNCRFNITAFRMNDLDVRDPHVYVDFIGCRDVTDTQLVGFSVNNELQTNIQTDGDGDGLLDLSIALVFRQFSQAGGTTQDVELHFPDCTAPMSSTVCTASGSQVVMATATNMASGTCLMPLPGTVRPYSPAVSTPSGPCFVTSAVTVTIDLGGIPITLRDARIAGTYVGNPATTLSNGLLMGFISEADANATIIPDSFPLVGGEPLSSLLPGGAGNCRTSGGFSDKDVNNGVMGWWFYLNFPAARRPFT